MGHQDTTSSRIDVRDFAVSDGESDGQYWGEHFERHRHDWSFLDVDAPVGSDGHSKGYGDVEKKDGKENASEGEEDENLWEEIEDQDKDDVIPHRLRRLQANPLPIYGGSYVSVSSQLHFAPSSGRRKQTLGIGSPSSYRTAASQIQSFHTPISFSSKARFMKVLPEFPATDWRKFLESKNLIPDDFNEQNWSGRGQHAEYTDSDKNEIPLIEEGNILGYTATAIVDSVRCRRIRLARKRINCTRTFRPQDAIHEVEHLQSLRHAHIVRIVGTYVLPKVLAILLYPVADWNLETFLDLAINDHDLKIEFCKECHQHVRETVKSIRVLGKNVSRSLLVRGKSLSVRGETFFFLWSKKPSCKQRSPRVKTFRRAFLLSFIPCLADIINYLHQTFIKHKDIKPGNILVKWARESCCSSPHYTLYLADFGISRAYSSLQESVTDNPTARTLTYAAPEVMQPGPRGLSADIFSLGCVFAEILAVIASPTPEDNELKRLCEVLANHEEQDDSYQANIPALREWLAHLAEKIDNDWWHETCLVVSAMLDEKSERRPTAEHLSEHFPPADCCLRGPPEFQAETYSTETKSTP